MKISVSVVILTYNEERNISQALNSVCGWAQVFILDSLSKDRTIEIAKRFDCVVFEHPFENYAKQRNFALDHLPIQTEWVLFLDADEWLPADIKEEISNLIHGNPEENGFYIKWRFIWMGKWIKHGYYPTWILRLFRYKKARCENRGVNEHLVVDGKIGYLKCDFIHEDHKDVTEWISKHNRYATMEAMELNKMNEDAKYIDSRFWGTQTQRKRWLRYRIFNNLPPLLRPFLYFFYRYIVRGGFLDGKDGFIYHFLQGLWWYLLIDIKYLELKKKRLNIDK